MKWKGNAMLQAADSLMPTQLQELHLSGMEDAQIWSQLELRGQVITEVVETLFQGAWDDPMKALDEEDEDANEEDSDEGELSIEGMDIDMEDCSSDEDDEGLDLLDEAIAEEDDDTSGDENMPEHITQLAGSSNDEGFLLTGLDLDRPSRLSKEKQSQPSQPRNRHPTLDDDFFSIVNFNKEIQAAEAQSKSRGRLDEDSDEESTDLFQAVPEDDELADQDSHVEGGCMCYHPSYCKGRGYSSLVACMYSDFFAPPPKTRRDKGKGRAESLVPSRDSRVRFHEEVRVKMVKSHGNMTSLHETGSDSDDEDAGGLDLFDQDEQEVADSLEEDDGEEEEGGDESDEDEDGEGGRDDEEQDEDAFETMERFKDDLFIAEEPEETSELFQCPVQNTD